MHLSFLLGGHSPFTISRQSYLSHSSHLSIRLFGYSVSLVSFVLSVTFVSFVSLNLYVSFASLGPSAGYKIIGVSHGVGRVILDIDE